MTTRPSPRRRRMGPLYMCLGYAMPRAVMCYRPKEPVFAHERALSNSRRLPAALASVPPHRAYGVGPLLRTPQRLSARYTGLRTSAARHALLRTEAGGWQQDARPYNTQPCTIAPQRPCLGDRRTSGHTRQPPATRSRCDPATTARATNYSSSGAPKGAADGIPPTRAHLVGTAPGYNPGT